MRWREGFMRMLRLLVFEMLAKVRSARGGTCSVVILALVCLSLLLPGFFTGSNLSEKILRHWLSGSKSAEYIGDNLAADYSLIGLRPRSPNGCASCPLKVYVYDFPRKFNFGLLQKDTSPDQDLPWNEADPLPDWPKRSGLKRQHSIEYWMMRDLFDDHVEVEGGRAAVRVKYPEQADLFFVPFFSSLSFNKYGPSMRDPLVERDRILQEETVSRVVNSEWWKRSGGQDHVVVVHHPNAFRFYKHLLNASIFVVADFGRSTPNISSLNKDVVAPYTHVVPTFKDDNDEDPFQSRTRNLFFQGTTKRKDAGKVRARLQVILQNKTGVHFEEGTATAEGLEEATLGMRSSKYCLHPAGDTPSSCRLFDAIVSHCVPVIISDKIELPFEDELNYSSFALFFSEEEAAQDDDWLLEELGRVDKEEWLKMFLKLKEVTHYFEYQYPTKENDAVNMLWKQLHRKVPAIKLALQRKQRLKIADWWR